MVLFFIAMKNFETIRQYISENRWYLIAGFAALVVVDLVQLVIPRIFKFVIDELTAGAVDTHKLMQVCLVTVSCGVAICLFRFCWRVCIIGTSRRIEMHLRNRLFSHVIRIPLATLNTTRTGDIMARMTNDLEAVRMCTGIGMVAFFDTVFLGTAAIFFLLYINPLLTLLTLTPMLAIMLITWRLSPVLHSKFKQVQSAFSDLTETVREALSAIWVVKAYTMEGHVQNSFGTMSRTYIQRNMALIRVMGMFFPLIMVCSNLSIAVLLCAGGRLAIDQSITTGDFVAFASYLWILTWPMMALGWVANLFQRGKASLQRINELLEKPTECLDEHGPGAPPAGLDITVRNLTFSYAPQLPDALRDVSVHIRQGQTIGITGTTGSGKSTLCSLLLRFYDPPPGTIFIDGTDIRTMPLTALRRLFAYVPQDSFLFSQSLTKNITFGCESCDDEVEGCASDAQVLHDIQQLSQGFETIVGEKGLTLSGGQRQRVCIARALITQSPILILDDAASSLDVETTQSLITSLKRLSGNRTLIIISNRIATIQHADMILVFDDGRIVGSGVHEMLSSQTGLYRQLYLRQQLEEENI